MPAKPKDEALRIAQLDLEPKDLTEQGYVMCRNLLTLGHLTFCWLLSSVAAAQLCGVSHLTNPTGEGLGGGPGYSRIVDPGDGVVVSDEASLLTALAHAQSGDVVYVTDTAVIDLTDIEQTEALVIPAGVTLASGRGRNGSKGALIFTDSFPRPLLTVGGADVRVSGLRLRGPSQSTAQVASSTGLSSRFNNLEVDNCEFFGWTHAAVSIDASTAYVHNNNFHHNRRQGLGYGVVHSGMGTFTLIEGNIFNANRHAIAGTGRRLQHYVARHNLVLWTANGHVFDMHAECEPGEFQTGSPWAGGLIEIENNTVLTSARGVFLRGSPFIEARVENNAFSVDAGAHPVRAARFRRMAINSETGLRYCSEDGPDGTPLPQTPIINVSIVDNCYGVHRWLASSGASDDWMLLAASGFEVARLGFGDFNGDGETDVFRTTGAEWQVSWSATAGWARLNTSAARVGSLGFADFDGDGETDVFRTSSGTWQVSWSGSSTWDDIATSSFSLSALRFGDFNGDGRADVFRRSGRYWFVSFGRDNRAGMTRWKRVRTFSASGGARSAGSGGDIANLRFGDFDADGATDVFMTDDGGWYVARGDSPDDGACDVDLNGSCRFGSWQRVNSSNIALQDLAFADLDGDGRTDVLRTGGGRFQVSWGATSGWTALGQAPPFFVSEMAFGDFNGDGTDDVFVSHQAP